LSWELLIIKCFIFPQMERLARADILVKDLYVENAHLIATVQRLEQHCQVLVQMTSDCSSVWIWLCHSQIYWFRTLGGGGVNVINKVRGFMCSGLWCYVAGWVLPNILKNHSAFMFAFKELHDLNDKDSVMLRIIGNYSPSITSQKPWIFSRSIVGTSDLALLQSILKCRIFHKGVINK